MQKDSYDIVIIGTGAGGGTAEGLYVLSCKEEVTKQQAERLEATLHE